MIAKSRLETLLDYLKDDPDDSFTHYAIALEHISGNEHQKAIQQLRHLLNKDENYLAAYYQLGKLYEKENNITEANTVYLKGIEKAKQQRNNHTLMELLEAYNSLNGIEDDH